MAARRRKSQARRGSGGGPVWLWFGAGVLFGLGAATLGARLGLFPQPGEPGETPADAGNQHPRETTATEQAPRQFDFLSKLPQSDPEVVERQPATERPGAAAAPERSGPYLLQVGSFKSASDADSVRARLALLGLEASVETARMGDDTWHRVRLGPFESASRTDQLLSRLRDQGYDPMILQARTGEE